MRRQTIFSSLLAAGIGSLLILYLYSTRWRPSFSIQTIDPSSNIAASAAANSSSPILLVSAFFPISNSRHSLSDYRVWLTHFLVHIETPVYFFAPSELADLIREVRPSHLPLTLNTSFATPWDIPPLRNMRAPYTDMHRHDREASRYSPELYAVHNAKPYLLEEGQRNAALEMNNVAGTTGHTHEYVFWVDAESFRVDHRYARWPGSERVREVFDEGARLSRTPKKDLIFFPVARPPSKWWQEWTEDRGPIDADFSEGSFFGGSPRAISWWREIFYNQHDKYFAAGMSVGKDQPLINALLFLHSRRFITVWIDQPKPFSPSLSSVQPMPYSGHHCGMEWYYYIYFLATPEEREAMRVLWDESARSIFAWSAEWRWSWKWAKMKWAEQRAPSRMSGDESICPLKDVLSIERLLKTEFGSDWPTIHTSAS